MQSTRQQVSKSHIFAHTHTPVSPPAHASPQAFTACRCLLQVEARLDEVKDSLAKVSERSKDDKLTKLVNAFLSTL